MITGVTDALRLASLLTPSSQTITSAATSKTSATSALQAQPQNIPVAQFRTAAYERWGRIAEAQHKVTSTQIANFALGQIIQRIKVMQALIPKALEGKPEAQQQLVVLRDAIQQYQPQYLGIPIFDHLLNLRLSAHWRARRRFRFANFKLAMSKTHNETITLHIPTIDGPQAVRIALPAHAEPRQLAMLINQKLSPFGIQLEVEGGEESFQCEEQVWPWLASGIRMSGEGQRLPAGNTLTMQINEIINWQDARDWHVLDPQALQLTARKLAKVRKKLEQQKQGTQKQLEQLMRLVQENPNAIDEQFLERLQQQFVPSPFTQQLKSLLAQANLGRQQTQALLLS